LAHLLQGLIALSIVILGAVLSAAPGGQSVAAPQASAGRTKFSHAVHLKLGDLGPILRAARERNTHLRPDGHAPGSQCQACHSSVVVDARREPLSQMGDCLVCHPKTDPPFSCSFCHAGDSSALKPVSHSRDFLDRHTGGLGKLNLVKSECAVCHGRKFTCLGCH
jgi:hypothetical protein